MLSDEEKDNLKYVLEVNAECELDSFSYSMLIHTYDNFLMNEKLGIRQNPVSAYEEDIKDLKRCIERAELVTGEKVTVEIPNRNSDNFYELRTLLEEQYQKNHIKTSNKDFIKEIFDILFNKNKLPSPSKNELNRRESISILIQKILKKSKG